MNHGNRTPGRAGLDAVACGRGNRRGNQCAEGNPEEGAEPAPDDSDMGGRSHHRNVRHDEHISYVGWLLAALYRGAGKLFPWSFRSTDTQVGFDRPIRVADSRRPVESHRTGKGNARETQNILMGNAVMLSMMVLILVIAVDVVQR